MRNFFILLKVEMLTMFSGSKSKKQKSNIMYALLTIFSVAIFGFLDYMIYSTTPLFQQLPKLYLFFISMLSFVMSGATIFQAAPSYIFNFKDFDILMSLPIKKSTILGVKAFKLYVYDLYTSLMILLPAIVIVGVNTHFSIFQYLIAIVASLIFPMLPFAIISSISTLIMFLSSKFKHVQFLNTIFSIIFIFIFAFSFSFVSSTIDQSPEAINNALVAIQNIFENSVALRPVLYFTNAIINPDIFALLKLLALSVIPVALFLALFSNVFFKINAGFQEQAARTKKTKYKATKGMSVSSSLLKKEFMVYFKTPQYFFQTAFGIIMISIFLIVGIIFGGNEIIRELTSVVSLEKSNMIVESLFIISMFCITAYFINLAPMSVASISVEGESLWVTSTLPVKTKNILKTKTLIHPIIALVPTILSVIFAIRINILSPMGVVLLFLFMLSYEIFISNLGLIINLSFPKFDWKTPAEIFKKSFATVFFIIMNIVSIAVIIGGYVLMYNSFLTPQNELISIVIFTLFFALLSLIMKIYISKGGAKKYQKIVWEH